MFISMDELFDALMTLKTGKVCGCDSLSLLFYRKFWKLLVGPLHRMLQLAYTTGYLSASARRGIINLIPKKCADETQVQSWRPISLLNYDYKLCAKALSNRMDIAIDSLVGPQQTGFIRGRSICSNLAKTRDVLAYLNRKNRPGVIAIVDYSKCFNRLEYNLIAGVLRYYNYGEEFIKMLSLLFADFHLNTINNRFQSDLFVKHWGVNQGCPASPGIYTQTCAVIEHLIQQNSNIKGISIGRLEYILSQFADDTSAFLSSDPLTIEGFCNVLSTIEEQLVVSYDKTSLYRVGSLAHSNAKVYTSKALKWTNEDIETLGVTFNVDGSPAVSNVKKIEAKIDKVCNDWYDKGATVMGTVLLINTLIGSLFVYYITVMMDLSPKDVHRINKKIHNFLWKGKKRGRVAFGTLQCAIEDSGLKLINLEAKQDMLKIAQIFKLENSLFKIMYEALHIKKLCCLIWKCNLSTKDVPRLFTTQSYWVELLRSWSKINYT